MRKVPVLSGCVLGGMFLWLAACGETATKAMGPEAGAGGGSGDAKSTGERPDSLGGGDLTGTGGSGDGRDGAEDASATGGSGGDSRSDSATTVGDGADSLAGTGMDAGRDTALGGGGSPDASDGGMGDTTGFDGVLAADGAGGLDTTGRDAAAEYPIDAPQPPQDTPPETGPETTCVGKGDFTPCNLLTSPDRHYDICVASVCVSPGCGDATCNTPGPHFALADTGQRACYDNAALLTCPAIGQAFDGQDAQYGWDVLHGASERFNQDSSLAGQPTVVDNVTGLMWKGCAAGMTGETCATGSATTFTWQEAVAYCDALDWGGFRDWHLPDPYELNSIAGTVWWTAGVDSGIIQSQGPDFWSSSSVAGDATQAWSGSASLYGFGRGSKTVHRNVLCVRGGAAWTTLRFNRGPSTDSQPVVVDGATGLVWQGCLAGLSGNDCATGSTPLVRSWSDALATCEGLVWAGRDDWRLPNFKELLSIADFRHFAPAVDASAFPGLPATLVDAGTVTRKTWSSSSSYDQGYAVDLEFDGAHTYATKAANSNHLRCVRDKSE